MIRAVLDPNVFISGILSEGVPRAILSQMTDERFELLASSAILEEIGRVLRYPKIARRHHWSEIQISSYVESLGALASITPGKLSLSVLKADPSDNRYLECAVEGEADYLVTGDRHLLDLRTHGETEILTPAEFLERLS